MVAVTSLGDIAGQVTQKSQNADKLTVGGVCLPSGTIKSVRSAIPADFPKWRNATDLDVEFMVDLILSEALSVCAASLDKTVADWQNFWADAYRVHHKTASLSGGSISYLKAATLIKFLLFVQVAGLAVTHSIKVGTMPQILDRKGRLHVTENVIFDDEIHGQDNREAFVEIWREINAHQPKLNSLGIYHEVKTLTLATEEREPLLLLPDYAAGIVHAANSAAETLAKSQVSMVAAKRAYARLKAATKFHEFVVSLPRDYFEIFPQFATYFSANVPQPFLQTDIHKRASPNCGCR